MSKQNVLMQLPFKALKKYNWDDKYYSGKASLRLVSQYNRLWLVRVISNKRGDFEVGRLSLVNAHPVFDLYGFIRVMGLMRLVLTEVFTASPFVWQTDADQEDGGLPKKDQSWLIGLGELASILENMIASRIGADQRLSLDELYDPEELTTFVENWINWGFLPVWLPKVWDQLDPDVSVLGELYNKQMVNRLMLEQISFFDQMPLWLNWQDWEDADSPTILQQEGEYLKWMIFTTAKQLKMSFAYGSSEWYLATLMSVYTEMVLMRTVDLEARISGKLFKFAVRIADHFECELIELLEILRPYWQHQYDVDWVVEEWSLPDQKNWEGTFGYLNYQFVSGRFDASGESLDDLPPKLVEALGEYPCQIGIEAWRIWKYVLRQFGDRLTNDQAEYLKLWVIVLGGARHDCFLYDNMSLVMDELDVAHA